jgi:hypothetical protein
MTAVRSKTATRSPGAQAAAPAKYATAQLPQARFQGSVRVGQERFAISDASGMLCHYWGVRLPARWCWVSASNLVGGGRGGGGDRAALPAVGPAPPQLDTGYLFVTQGDRTRMLVSPLTALMRLRGSWHDSSCTRVRWPVGRRSAWTAAPPPSSTTIWVRASARPCWEPAALTGPARCQDRRDRSPRLLSFQPLHRRPYGG